MHLTELVGDRIVLSFTTQSYITIVFSHVKPDAPMCNIGSPSSTINQTKKKKEKKKSQMFTSVRHASLVAAQEHLNIAMLNTSCKVSVNCHVQ